MIPSGRRLYDGVDREPILDTNEEWRAVPGTHGKYRVSDAGRVAGPTGVLAGMVTRDGYRRVNLQYPEGHRQKVIHKLVAEMFIGPQPPGTEVRLIDGNKLNIAIANVAYVPRGSGAAKATGARPPRVEHRPDGSIVTARRQHVRIGPGRPLRGEECGRAVLTEADARDILAAYVTHSRRGRVRKRTATADEIAQMYGVSRSTIFKLVRGESWRHVHLQLFGGLPADRWQPTAKPRRLTPTDAIEWAAARARILRQTKATVRQGGTTYIRTMKSKELRVENLGELLDQLISRQGYRCAQSGVGFDETDADLRASLDRLDSDGHYELGNLQLVTSWYNLSKGTRSDSEMRRLVGIHAGLFEADSAWPPRLPDPVTPSNLSA